MPRVAVDGGMLISYERKGQGTPLLLIGGLGCDMRFWRPFQLPTLSKHHDTIIYDNRGIGGSDKPEGPYSTAEMADDAAGLLSAVGVDTAHVLGVSMGGMIALELAIRHPARLRSLVVACGIARSDAWMRFKQVGNQKLAQLPVEDQDLREAMARMNLLWMCAPGFFEQPEVVDRALNLMQEGQQPWEAYCWQSQALHDHDATDGLAGIGCPTLVMVGREDILTPIRYAEEIAQGIPGAELKIFDNAGHLFMFERADDFNSAVLEFLASVDSRAACS